MKKKGFLKRAFTTAALAVTVIAGSAEFAQAQVPSNSVGRPLTPGEKEMTYLFGPEVQIDSIRWHAGPSHLPTAAETFDDKTIAAYGHPFLALDYSKDPDPFNYGMYFHETTHIWQFGHQWQLTKGHCPGGYHYDLKPGMVFTDFCSEAQAAIVEDYVRRYIRPVSTSSNWYVDMCGQDTPEHDALLLKAVETQFPRAREMRLKIHRGEVLPDAKPFEPGHTCKIPPHNPPPGPDGKGGNPPPPPPDGGHKKGDDPQNGNPPNGGGGKPPVAQGGDGPESFQHLKRGKPTFFCDALDYTFGKIKLIADKEGVKDWPGLTAKINDKAEACVVSLGDDHLAVLGAPDFKDGLMRSETLNSLVIKIAEQSPPKIRAAVNKNLAMLFNEMSDRQKAEKLALTHIKTLGEAEKTKAALETQLKEDPSLPDNSRAFLQEKVKILDRMIAKFEGHDVAPDSGTKPVTQPPVVANNNGTGTGKGTGGDHRRAGAGPVKKADSEFLDPDRNIKKILDSAFGKQQMAQRP